MAIDKALLRTLLQIPQPWEVQHYKVDWQTACCNVWIGVETPKTWFGKPKQTLKTTTHDWRHVNLGALKIVLHVAVPENADTTKHAWAGETGMPFTRALSKQIFALLNHGVSLENICSLMNVALSDLWRYRYALDHGKARVDAAPTPSPPIVSASSSTAHSTLPGVAKLGGIPDLEHPIWVKIATGHATLDIKNLSFKLLLARIQSQMNVITDDEVRMLKVRELHRYFVKNAAALSHELAQLKA